MLEYKSPSATESPEVECIIVESVDPEGPFGAKEASEGSLAATIPAIANAIYDAVGVRLREAPFTPERVLAAIKAKHGEKKSLEMTRGSDPSAPTTFREHGGSLWFKGKGPERHAEDPSTESIADRNMKTYHGDTETRRKAKIFVANLRGSTQIRSAGFSSQKRSSLYRSALISANPATALFFSVPPCLRGEFKN